MRKVRAWLPLAISSTILTLLVFGSVQQVLRLGANDPQIQLASDAAARLASGAKAADILTTGTPLVDASASLAPFMIIYDESGRVVASGGTLNGSTPTLPPGVLEASRSSVQNRITWQPAPGVRLATVVSHVQGGAGGFVLSARNLHEVEQRIGHLQLYSTLALVGLLAITLGLSLLI